MERKKIGQIQGRKNRRRLVRNPTIQYTIINLHIKYDYSSSHSLAEIFDEKFQHSKYGKKENWTNTGKNKRRRLVRDPTIQYIIINLYTKYEYSSLHSFTEIFDEKFHHSKYGKKEIGQIQGRISRRRLVCNPTIQHVIINLYTKYYFSSLQGCGEIFDEKVLRNYGIFQSGGIINDPSPRKLAAFCFFCFCLCCSLHARVKSDMVVKGV